MEWIKSNTTMRFQCHYTNSDTHIQNWIALHEAHIHKHAHSHIHSSTHGCIHTGFGCWNMHNSTRISIMICRFYQANKQTNQSNTIRKKLICRSNVKCGNESRGTRINKIQHLTIKQHFVIAWSGEKKKQYADCHYVCNFCIYQIFSNIIEWHAVSTYMWLQLYACVHSYFWIWMCACACLCVWSVYACEFVYVKIFYIVR